MLIFLLTQQFLIHSVKFKGCDCSKRFGNSHTVDNATPLFSFHSTKSPQSFFGILWISNNFICHADCPGNAPSIGDCIWHSLGGCRTGSAFFPIPLYFMNILSQFPCIVWRKSCTWTGGSLGYLFKVWKNIIAMPTFLSALCSRWAPQLTWFRREILLPSFVFIGWKCPVWSCGRHFHCPIEQC
jgi:hypothetical protein